MKINDLNKNVSLIVLPHQDDEFFILPYIEYLLKIGRDIRVIYITNGKYSDHDPVTRINESQKTLSNYGVDLKNIVHYGYENSVNDSEIPFKLNQIHDYLKNLILSYHDNVVEILAPAWEGGHQDHDALNRVILNILHGFNKTSIFHQFYLYNSYKTIAPFFRVMYPVCMNEKTKEFCFTFKSSIRAVYNAFNYKSQYKTFFGILIPSIVQFTIFRKIYLQIPNPQFNLDPPHSGILLYERRRRFEYSNMLKNLKKYKISIE